MKRLGPLLLSFLLSACASLAGTEQARPALLASPDEQTQQALVSAISQALGTKHIRLGKGAFTKHNKIIIELSLPQSLDRPQGAIVKQEPDVFLLLKRGKKCLLRHQNTGKDYPLDTVACSVI